MDRRDVLKVLSLAALAVAGGGALSGCGDDQGAGGEAGLVAADVPRAAVDPTTISATVAAISVSGGALFGTLAAGDGNLALSPYSIAVALAMTANGAGGETRGQLEIALGGQDVADVNAGLNALGAHLATLPGTFPDVHDKNGEVDLAAANALFGQRDVTWGREFLEALARDYGTGMRTVDWVDDTEDARAEVNAWTAEQTHDRIPEILPPGAVDTMTRLVLVNALYFKAPWESPFEKSATTERGFTLLDGTEVRVPTMEAVDLITAPVATGPGWTSVSLPYVGRQVAMTIVLPDAGRYARVEKAVVDGRLADFLPAPDAPTRSVGMFLPSWTFRTEAPLKSSLQGLGVTLPFEQDADFRAMTADDRLFVDDVLHQTFVAVDEAGTEAAAATAVVMRNLSAPFYDLTLTVDRPFLFVVHDLAHGTPLFLGRVLDPRAS